MISLADISRLRSKISIDRHLQEHFGGDAAGFIADINSAINNLLQTDLGQARQFIDQLPPCFKHLSPFHRPRLLAIEARFAHWSGQSKIALRKYQTAIDRLQKVRNFDAAARARQGLMDVYMYLGDYQAALEVGRLALSYFRRMGNKNNAARVMTNIGNIYHRLDRNKLSLRYYDRARDFFETQGGVPLAILDFNRANIYTNLNRLDKAEELYRSVAERFREYQMDLAVGKAEYSLAYLYFLGDKYTMALKAFDRVMDTFQKSGDTKSVAITQLDLAEINTHLNQFGSAVLLGERASVTCSKLGLRYEEAKSAYFVAEAYRQLGDSIRSTRYLNRAEKLFLREDNKLWQGMVNLTRSRLKTAAGRYAEAQTTASAAHRLFKQSGDARRSIDAEITLMEIYLEGGRPDEVIRLGRQLLKNHLVSYQRHLVLYHIGVAYLRKSNPQTALEYLKRAIKVVEKIMENIYPDEIRFFFALDKYPTYLSAVNCLLQMNRVEESFLQHSHALGVLNLRQKPSPALTREVPDHLLETRSALRASLKKMSRVPDNSRRLAPAGTMYHEEHRLWDTERRIRSYLYPSTHKHQLPIPGPTFYSEAIGAGEVLINFFSIGQTAGAFCAYRGSTRYIPCPVPHSDLEAAVRELHFLMEMSVHAPGGSGHSRDVISHYLRKLYEWLIEPMDFPPETDKLVLMVDGLYAQLPFPALIDARGTWLKDRYDIRIIVNPDDLRNRSNSSRFSRRRRNAIFTPSNSGLPLVEIEGQRIKEAFSSAHLYAGETAHIENLRRELEQSGGFIHIATHASRSCENPLFSKIILSDGPFFPFDLFGTEIRAQLVTLSGCQTAAPGIYYGNSFSLAKAFYQGGANHVLASLWPISDKISVIYMTEFYEALKVHGDIATAYGTAMNKTCAINDNPAFWAPFVMIGI